MRNLGTRVARLLAAFGAACALLASTATVAIGGTDHFFGGTLPAGFGFAGANPHSINYIEGTANFNGFCVAKDTGLTGFDFATRAVAGARTCATSGQFAARYENGACCYHGWIDNQTAVNMMIYSYYSY
jgi:hypothetical protein